MLKRSRSPLRVVVLGSHRMPGLAELLADPDRGTRFEVVGALTSEASCREEGLLRHAGLPLLHRPVREIHAAHGAALGDRTVRRACDRDTADLLEGLAPDLVLLAGYLFVVTEPLLERHAGRIVNVHHADLRLRHADGTPVYPGLRAVYDAVAAGETETRASAHLVTPQLDAGPVILVSWPFPVSPLARRARELGAEDMLRAYAFAHQEWMLRDAWGPLLVETVRLFAAGILAAGDESVVVEGEPEPLELAPVTPDVSGWNGCAAAHRAPPLAYEVPS